MAVWVGGAVWLAGWLDDWLDDWLIDWLDLAVTAVSALMGRTDPEGQNVIMYIIGQILTVASPGVF